MKKILPCSFFLLLLLASKAVNAQPFPNEIGLPNGFFPEGFAVGQDGPMFYAGSLGSGAIYKGDLRTGTGSILVPPPAPGGSFGVTSGLSVDAFNRVWVAGGLSGNGRVYHGDTGALLGVYTFTDPFQSLINDVITTPKAVYFTDSGTQNDIYRLGTPRIFVVRLGNGGALPPPGDVSAIDEVVLDVALDADGNEISLDLAFPNLNGIETLPGYAEVVIVGHTILGFLLLVDLEAGTASKVDLVGTDMDENEVNLPGNDGLVRSGNTLYVVYGGGIAEVELTPDGSSGVVKRNYAVTNAETPTTAGLFGNAVYTVDARFISTATSPDPTTLSYKVYRTELN